MLRIQTLFMKASVFVFDSEICKIINVNYRLWPATCFCMLRTEDFFFFHF